MTSLLARRLAAVACATVVAGGLAAVSAQTASATPVVAVVTSSSFVDTIDQRHIVGEVQNNGTTNLENVVVTISYLDATGGSLGQGEAIANVKVLAPREKSPFHLTFATPAGYSKYTLAVSADDSALQPNHNFTPSITSDTTDAQGFRHLVGTARNDNATDADFVEALFTFYNAAGQVVNTDATFVNDDTIAPGATSAIVEDISGPAFTRYTVTAQSGSAPARSASPSPSPSPSSVASPTASPTASPSASEATSPTASPSASASASSAPDVPPTVSLAPAVINAGQRVTVTYRGAPGSTLEIWSKTQPATSYSRIGSVTLDGNGTGTSSHAPTKNTRIVARTASGASSDQPLISVRSVASLSARRVSTRVYAFTGRVYPARPGRLVSLYRNGALVAQARTDATGVYSMTTTLSAGSYSFQTRTATDTYNVGTTSPARTYAIS